MKKETEKHSIGEPEPQFVIVAQLRKRDKVDCRGAGVAGTSKAR
jgi:hypothetical protein